MRLGAVLIFVSLQVPLHAEKVSYSREVRPILSNKCFFCHGPDPAKREADLRLDTFEGAIGKREKSDEIAIVPRNPKASAALTRMLSTDPDEMMPPPKSHLKMEPEEIEVLRRWVEQGAVYEPHWAFQPLPATVALPEILDGSWATNEIDRFVLARLEKEKLRPSAPADAGRLLRRLSFDLTGLPPTPAEIAAFDPKKEEEAVDRLIASPHFGEAMALDWLDAARYSDSYGYQSDLLTPQWPWRDWVIRAFNENLSYDQFVTWQIAGDLLPGATQDQILATAFNRLNRMTQEGGSIHEEYRIEGVADRTHTFGTAFLALTVECARCHDHKYDPISARDYYSIGAFFNSIPERGVYSAAALPPGPLLLLPTPDQEDRLKAAQSAIDQAQAELDQARAAPSGQPTVTPIPDQVAFFNFDTPETASNNGVAESAVKKLNLNGLSLVDSPGGKAVAFTGDAGVGIPGLLTGEWPQAWTVDFSVNDSVANPQAVVLWQRSFGTDAGYNGLECTLAGGCLEVRLIHDWPGIAVGVKTKQVITKDQWHRVAITWDGSGKAAGLKIFLNGQVLPTEVTSDHLYLSVIVPTYGDGTFTLGERFRDRGFMGGKMDHFGAYSRALDPLEIYELGNPGSLAHLTSDPAMAQRLRPVLIAQSKATQAAEGKLQAAREALVKIRAGVHAVSVMEEMPNPRLTWILARGVYDAPYSKEVEVTRNPFEKALPPFSADLPRNRLGLARWLTDPDHPLTARVYVNRVWQHFFGTGIVATSNNFGFQGSLPTHPELLDWLARDFVAHGWDIKRLCRQIVMSSTYRQDSRLTPELRERDPGNTLLARGPARRLAAEPIRDLSLAAAEVLVPLFGGPPVSPYQPGPDLWRESNSMTSSYVQSKGEDLLRRSIYSVWKRTAPLPNALIFDAPGREACTIKRSSTNTPLQALVLLNDTQYVEPSRALAEKMLRTHPDDSGALISDAFLRLAGRLPDARETELLKQLLDDQLKLFKDKPAEAKAFLAVGENFHPEDLDPGVLAAHAVLCQSILNLDAVIWER